MPIYPRQSKRNGTVYDVVINGGPKPVWRRGFLKRGPVSEPGTALYEEARLRNELRLGRGIPSEKLTLGEYLNGIWLPSRLQGNAGTYRLHRYMVQRGAPLLKTKLTRLRATEVDRWRQSMQADGLMPNTVRGYVLRLATALEYAKRLGLVNENAARAVDVPAMQKRTPWILTVPEVRELLGIAERTPHGPLIALAIFTAKRWDELTRLTWRDVDFERQTFYVRTAKNEASTNGVPLTGLALTELALQRRRVQEMRAKAGEHWQDHDLVFCGKRGQAVARMTFNYYWRRTIEARWPGLHFHDLRHEAATLMAWAGVHPKTAAALVGHGSEATTMEIYTHVNAENQRSGAEAVEALIRGHS